MRERVTRAGERDELALGSNCSIYLMHITASTIPTGDQLHRNYCFSAAGATLSPRRACSLVTVMLTQHAYSS